MTNKMALEVLKSWLAVAYQNTDGTDASSAELYEALQTIFHLINIQHEQIEKLQEVVFKQKETMQLIGLEKQQYFDELQTAKSEVVKEFVKEHKEIMRSFLDDDNEFLMKWCEYEANTDNLVKEMVGNT